MSRPTLSITKGRKGQIATLTVNGHGWFAWDGMSLAQLSHVWVMACVSSGLLPDSNPLISIQPSLNPEQPSVATISGYATKEEKKG